MSIHDSVLGSKVRHLLDVVAQHRDEKCAAIRVTAQARAKAQLQTAWHEARERLHNDNVETRRHVEQTLASHEAQQQTHRRQQRQADDEALLATAREALQVALLQRWQQPGSRQQWCEVLVNAAVTTLDGKVWRVEHPTDWPVSEHDALRETIISLCGKAPRLQANADINAGLRICVDGTCMDATIGGLLHDQARIDAELLALCTACAGGGA
jgi:Asp-tRNA(Asn)/Glu-tRNA(Gln) amidotransferase A subunit family amidase